jgi:hypothetical protein
MLTGFKDGVLNFTQYVISDFDEIALLILLVGHSEFMAHSQNILDHIWVFSIEYIPEILSRRIGDLFSSFINLNKVGLHIWEFLDHMGVDLLERKLSKSGNLNSLHHSDLESLF